MKNNSPKRILNAIAVILHVPGIMAVISMLIALIFAEYYALPGFAILALVTVVPGQIIYRKISNARLNISETMIAATIGWIISALVGAIPFLATSMNMGSAGDATRQSMLPFHAFTNAFFESMSGFTSTGLSMADHPSALPHSIQWWRSFMQWVGGIGIIVFISQFSHPQITPVESHYTKKFEDKALPAISVDWKYVWSIYMAFTILSILLFLVQGIPVWESVNHGLSAISTGGFTITEGSMQNYATRYFPGIWLMIILGSLNFKLFSELFTKFHWKKFITNGETIFFIAFLIIGSLAILWIDDGIPQSDKVFQVVSALGTCGFQSSDLTQWGNLPLMILIIAMFIGGTTNSTTGGIKIFRLLLLVKGSFYNALYWVYKPKGKFKFRFEHHSFKESTTLKIFRNAATFLIIWILFYMIGTMVLIYNVPDSFGLREIFFESTSAYSCVGLSTGITDSTLNLTARIDLILIMLVGRMELIPLLVLISSVMKIFSNTQPYRR